MNDFVGKVATAATLGVALLPWIALSVAHAQPASAMASNLKPSQPAYVQVLDSRAAASAIR